MKRIPSRPSSSKPHHASSSTNIRGDRAKPLVTNQDLATRGSAVLPYVPPHPWRGVGTQRFLTVLLKHRHPLVDALPTKDTPTVPQGPDGCRGVGLALQYLGTEAGAPDVYRHRYDTDPISAPCFHLLVSLLLKPIPDLLSNYAQAKVAGHTHFQTKWTRDVTDVLCAPGNAFGLTEKIYAMPMIAESSDPYYDRHRFEFA